ncbi:PREDICTED: venom protease-like [Wasmannia auropunctata]|uniref:venom protease-like n=1 Tax=Wasmannia auropunctata TaxID=64793 RepID=UPI0005EF6C2E|nr:PREDICTED: venom protease-like [Wasmannia auropunctata]XP_011701246.1 PREDICTED: venom protease-like [Wasmannia auropunctata]
MSTVILVFIGLLCALIPSMHSQDTCRNPQGYVGTCINIKSCTSLFNLLKLNKENPQVLEFLRASICGYEGNDPKVCCPSSKSEYGPLYPPECGFSNVIPQRIVGGTPAPLGAWPWMTALGYTNSENPNVPSWLCGGVLITRRHVLTAGHCVYEREDLYKVRIGDLDLNDDYDGATPFEDFIERKTVHPEFDRWTLTNDVAVLKTFQEVPFTLSVHPICLPMDDFIRNTNLENTYPFVVGWGSVYFQGPKSSKLLQTQVPVVPQEKCRTTYQNTQAVIDNRVVCAGYAQGGKDACQGDSGGPLMLPDPRNKQYYYVVGIVSYGQKCAQPDIPGVYTKVPAFLDFIISQLV